MPEYRELPLDVLKVDPSYQRDLDPRWVERTVANYNPSLLGVLMVAEKDGEYWVWDGQGRLEVLRRLGKIKTWCQLTAGAGRKEQADLFLRQENRKGINWASKHKAGVTKDDPIAKDVDRIVKSINMKVGGTAPDSIRAVAALYWIYDRGGPILLDDTLHVASTSWSDSKYGFGDRSLKGLAVFLESFPGPIVDRSEAAIAFKDLSPLQAMQESQRAAQIGAGNNLTEFARYLLRNFNRATGRKLRSAQLELNADRRKRRSINS